MQQRVGLARAFATDADILLMDEPFSALDPLIREHLQDELLALQSRLKKTILFVSHDLDEAFKLGNQVSIMESGHIVQTGEVQDIVDNPANDYVRRFVANINPLSVLTARSVMRAIEHNSTDYHHQPSGLSLKLIEGCPVSAEIHGKSIDIAEDRNSLIDAEELICVELDTPIRELLGLASMHTTPIVVLNKKGMLCGLLQARDLCAQLSEG